MDKEEAEKKYHQQRRGAKGRGIAWEITFAEWLEWWGDDLDRRGRRFGQLSMQRIADSGPYRLDNIRKGRHARNAKTRSDMYRGAKSEKNKISHEEFLENLMPDGKDDFDENERELKKMFGVRVSTYAWYGD